MKKLTLTVVAFALSAAATAAVAQSAMELATPAAADPAVRESMTAALKRTTSEKAMPPAGLQSGNASGSGSLTGPSLAADAATPSVKSTHPAK